MPRIPNHQYPEDDDWDNDDEFNIEDDEPRDRRGRKTPKEDLDYEQLKRNHWSRRYRDDR